MSTVILEGNESVIVITEENPGTLVIENEAPVVVEIVETPATVVATSKSFGGRHLSPRQRRILTERLTFNIKGDL